MTFSDLSSPDPADILKEDTNMIVNNNIDHDNKQQTKEEQLKSSLGIDDSLVIAHDEKVVYNYAAQQLQSTLGINHCIVKIQNICIYIFFFKNCIQIQLKMET